MPYLPRVRDFYVRYERPIASISLVSGFIFDAVTLTRVDALRDNLWVTLNLLVVAVIIILLNRQENESIQGESSSKRHFWLVTIMQFSFGSLLGTFLIFYFRSATLAASWPFLLLLLLAILANDHFKKHYERLAFQISFFFLSVFAFFIFLIPILLNRIGAPVFILSGVVSLLVLWFYLRALAFFAHERFHKSKRPLRKAIVAIFVGINALYFTNIIPPIPLSLSDAGIYHFIFRDLRGDYIVGYEDQGFWKYFHLYPDFHLPMGGSAHAYSAVFSPTSFNIPIFHVWQKEDKVSGKWITESRIRLTVSGGRDGGFRTYSEKTGLSEGKWRVNVETERGQILGTIRFKVIPVLREPPIQVGVNR